MKAIERNFHRKNQIAMRNAKASLAVEGMYLTPEEDELLSLKAQGQISDSEFLARALELAKNERSLS